MSDVAEGNQGPLTGVGLTGTAMFMATDVLIAINDREHIVQTPAYDLQSFCWVILYVVYKAALKATSSSSLNGWTGEDIEDIKQLKKEYTELFSAATVENLLEQRSRRLSPVPRYAYKRWREPANWAIANLMKYCKATAQEGGLYLQSLVDFVWHFLKQVEQSDGPHRDLRLPKEYALVPPFWSEEDDRKGQEDGDTGGAQTMSTGSIEAPGPVSLAEHDRFIQGLETLLNYMEAS
ncbi:hypothetical protein OH77DRAFT_1438171 [Trametes cingulata]|nr:hypothetical protein OH77DRAFT_1438171 [Trametes cingulata]